MAMLNFISAIEADKYYNDQIRQFQALQNIQLGQIVAVDSVRQRERLVEDYRIYQQLMGSSQPGMSRLGTVKEFRKKFKQYSKEEFRKMGSSPIVKDILTGLTKLNKDEITNRIKEHLQ